MRVTDLENIYELTPAQQGILFHCVHSPGSGVYMAQSLWSMRGALDLSSFRRAWQVAADRHAALRSAVYWEGLDTPQQAVFRGLRFPVDEEDWSDRSPGDQDADMRRLLAANRRQGFRLSEPPLSRLFLRRLGDREWRCVWSRHHILFDGWSQAVVLRDVFTAYASGANSAGLEPLTPYVRYIQWLRKQDRSRAERFWRALLSTGGAPAPLHKSGVHRRAATALPESAQAAVELTSEEARTLDRLLRGRSLTLTSFALGIWALLLARFTARSDVIFGVTISGRPPELEGVESMVGLFINTLPVKVSLADDELFSDLVRRLMVLQSEIAEHGYCSLTEIHSWSGAPRSEPLFESVVVVENYPKPDRGMASLCGLEVNQIDSYVQNNYPLTLRVSSGDRLEFQLLYDSSRVEPGVVRVLVPHLSALVRSASDLMDARVGVAGQILQRAEEEQCRSAARSIFAAVRRRGGNGNHPVEERKANVYARSELQS